MGTSHRHTPTVKGEPNWGGASKAITALTGVTEKLVALTVNPPEHKSTKQIARLQDQFERQITRNYHKAVGRLIKAAGGRDKVSSGSSRAIGYAGISVIGELVSSIQEIVSKGLAQWLHQRGVLLEGKRICDIIDIIRQYVEKEIVGLDHTAANEAMECVLDRLEELLGEDVGKIEDVMSAILTGTDIKNMIDLFFGMYIYSHLSQDFEEKLEYEKGSKAMKYAMDEIKEQILDDIRTGRLGCDVRMVDWSKPEGTAFIKAEFSRILFILQGNED